MSERLMVAQCPDWPVVASGEAMADPVGVLAAGRVLACSAAARAEGVEPGLRRRQAESRCPGLVVVAADPSRDAREFEKVVAAVEAFTPGVEIVRPGTVAFPTRGPSRYFGGDDSLSRKLVSAVDQAVASVAVGAPGCRVGAGDGRLAAELAAVSGAIVPPGTSREFLAPFPVSVLEASVLERPTVGASTDDAGEGARELLGLLVRLGIRTLGDLAGLPLTSLLARFGNVGLAAGRLARGLDEQPLSARTPPPDMAVTAEIDPPADRLDTAAFVARSLAEELHQRLESRGMSATRVLVEAETEHGDRFARLWRHGGGLSPSALAERVRWQLDGWMASGRGRVLDDGSEGCERTSGLVLLRLSPEEVGPAVGRQLGFWGGDRAAAEQAARAIARVQGALGPESVLVGFAAGGRGEAEQVSLLPWEPRAGDGAGGIATATRNRLDGHPPWPGRIPSPAPATVHSEPTPVAVVDADGRMVAITGRALVSAPPTAVAIDGAPAVEVVAWAGPWPVDERWWDPAAHRRRARAQVVTAEGDAHLLSVEGGRWSVEATYD